MYCCPAERGGAPGRAFPNVQHGRRRRQPHAGMFGQRVDTEERRAARAAQHEAAEARGRVTHVFEALVCAEPSAVIAACDTVRQMLANPASAVGGTSTPPSRQDWAASLRFASSPVLPSPLQAPANQSPKSESWWRNHVEGKSRQEIARVAAAQRRGELT